MCLASSCVILAHISNPDAFAQDATNAWLKMSTVNLSALSKTDALQNKVWADKIAQNNQAFAGDKRFVDKNAPAEAYIATFKKADATVIVSILSTLSTCETGANSKDAEETASTCTLRVTTIINGVLTNREYTACYVLPESGNSVEIKFDSNTNAIALRASMKNRLIADCNKTIALN